MQNEFEQYAETLLSSLPFGREEEIMIGNPEELTKYLAGTTAEALMSPQNSNLLVSVIAVALERIKNK